MALRTAFTGLFSLQHPIALAPMGGASGGALAAAVSNGGGWGLIGGARADPAWVAREMEIAAGKTGKPWGVGFHGGEETERSRVSDIAIGAPWPSKYPARTLRNPFFDRWRGREDELAADPAARQAYREAVARGDLPEKPVWASEAIDLITEISPAAELVGALAAQAEEALARAAGR